MKVGDYVQYKPDGERKYSITNERMLYAIVREDIDSRIYIEILKHQNAAHNGSRYEVAKSSFEVIENFTGAPKGS